MFSSLSLCHPRLRWERPPPSVLGWLDLRDSRTQLIAAALAGTARTNPAVGIRSHAAPCWTGLEGSPGMGALRSVLLEAPRNPPPLALAASGLALKIFLTHLPGAHGNEGDRELPVLDRPMRYPLVEQDPRTKIPRVQKDSQQERLEPISQRTVTPGHLERGLVSGFGASMAGSGPGSAGCGMGGAWPQLV